MKARGKCITCDKPIDMGSFFVVRLKGRIRSEHADCRRRKEGADAERKAIIAWLDEGIEYQARTAENDWDRAKLEANKDIRHDLATGVWRPTPKRSTAK